MLTTRRPPPAPARGPARAAATGAGRRPVRGRPPDPAAAPPGRRVACRPGVPVPWAVEDLDLGPQRGRSPGGCPRRRNSEVGAEHCCLTTRARGAMASVTSRQPHPRSEPSHPVPHGCPGPRRGAPSWRPLPRQNSTEGATAGASAARLGGGGAEFTAPGVPQEAFQPGDLAFPQISAPRAPHSPPVFTLRPSLFGHSASLGIRRGTAPTTGHSGERGRGPRNFNRVGPAPGPPPRPSAPSCHRGCDGN